MNRYRFAAVVPCVVGLLAPLLDAQPREFNYDEDKVPRYRLPDALVMSTGEKVASAETWTSRRRPEILRLFETQVYGRSPGAPEAMTFDVTSIDERALGGVATRKEVSVYFTDQRDDARMDILIYTPNA